MSGLDVLVTGLPRSGTTLTCELLNMVPDTVALDEPIEWAPLLNRSSGAAAGSAGRRAVTAVRARLSRQQAPKAPEPKAICDYVAAFCDSARRSIRERQVAPSRNVDGRVLGSKVADEYTESGLRMKLAEWGEIAVDKELSEGFLLAVKHTAGFTAVLGPLVERFPLYALVRNPLSVLSSWQTVPFPPQQGHVAMGEAFDPTLAAELARIDDRHDRQIHLLSWFFGRYRAVLDASSVIRYEDVVSSGAGALGAITPAAAQLTVPLENRNRGRGVYDADLANMLGERLLATDGPWWHFYSRSEVEELLAAN